MHTFCFAGYLRERVRTLTFLLFFSLLEPAATYDRQYESQWNLAMGACVVLMRASFTSRVQAWFQLPQLSNLRLSGINLRCLFC